MKASSQDLRERFLRAVDQGYKCSEIIKLFGMSGATIKRYIKQQNNVTRASYSTASRYSASQHKTPGVWRSPMTISRSAWAMS